MTWIKHRLPTAADADPLGMVRWGPALPGFLTRWQEVRPDEPWAHSTAWRNPAAGQDPPR
jgi:hypothetical protein